MALIALVLTVAMSVARAEHGVVKTTPLVDPRLRSYEPAIEMAGRITIAGSETMQPLVAALAAEFRSFHPGVKVASEGGGSERGFHAFLNGAAQQRRSVPKSGHEGSAQTMLLASSRQLAETEKRKFAARYGYEPLELPIAMDAIAIYVHPSNPIDGLTLAQIDALFSAEHRRGLKSLETWGQLGLVEGWESQPIRLYGRDTSSGTRRFFQDQVLMGGPFQGTVHEEKGAASELLAIGNDPLAIGYAGVLGYPTSVVRMVPLAERPGSSYIAPSPEAVRDGRYPLRRDLYLYANLPPGPRSNRVLLEFLRYVNSREGQSTVAKAKYYPVSTHQIEANMRAMGWVAPVAALHSASR